MATSLSLNPAAIERALVPTAAPVVISAAAPSAVPTRVHATHRVARGDTVWDLARHYGSTVTAIIDANNLDKRATIHVGEHLVIPGANAAASSSPANRESASKKVAPKKSTNAVGHTVKPGDTVWDLAQKYKTSVTAIVKANGLTSSALIHVGDHLIIPGATSSAAATPANSSTKVTTPGGSTESTTASSRYTVKSGDTLSSIATKFRSTVSKISGANGIDDPSRIRVGQVLTIPGGVPTGLVGDTFAGRTYSKDVVSGANTNKHTLNNMDVPTRAQMRALVEKTAKKYNVEVELALAIAYQESGFNMRAVSPANAVGVMQVIPSTGEWISTMVGRELDLLDSQDNVTAGVVLLSYLTRNASSLDQAIAGYYQGLSGVRKYGMNSDTKQYVASVRALMKKFD
jgi:LysM repeat protein